MTQGRNGMLAWRLALGLRLLLLVYGSWHDHTFSVKYTDVDYFVFSDAALHVTEGGSPYDRLTFRYSPLLAWIMLPNVFWFKSFGKLLFVGGDFVVAFVLQELLRDQGLDERWVYFWIFHPYSINISTRGNADSIACALVLLSALRFSQRRRVEAALWYGLAVHFRIYPIIFAPTFLLAILHKEEDDLRNCLFQGLKFSVLSGTIFLLLLGIFNALYGWPFVYETYLYHFTRRDNRHNFSVHFYSLYLQYDQPSSLALGLATFLPQVMTQLALVVSYNSNLVSCMCMQTMAFVSFNKVCTAQYFLWYTALLPIPLAQLQTSKKLYLPYVAVLSISWLVAQGVWLHQAYLLEFQGENTFLQLWAASIVFFTANIAVIASLASAVRVEHRILPSDDAKIGEE